MTEGQQSQPPSPEEGVDPRNLGGDLDAEDQPGQPWVRQPDEFMDDSSTSSAGPSNQQQPPAPTATPAPTTTPAPAAAPAPAPTVAGITLTPEQLQQLLSTTIASSLSSQHKQLVKLNKPRVGGLDRQGVWTGYGRNDSGMEPMSYYCYRRFVYDDLKSMQYQASIEEQCKAGLRATNTVLFCRDTEPNAGKGAQVLQELDQYLMKYGMEAVFRIHIGKEVIDMLKFPGLVNRPLVETWVDRLLTKGVTDALTGATHAVCPYDKLNLQLSAEAILNSCSETLRQDLIATIPASEMYGPLVLQKVLSIVYRAELAKLRDLQSQLESLNITKFDGENVSSFKLTAQALVREIEMTSPSPNPIPDLGIKALSGLTYSTCPVFHQWVANEMYALHEDSDSAKKASVALQKLDEAEAKYLAFKQMNMYPAAKKPTSEDNRYKAMMGKVSYLEKEMTKLSQDRSASSSKGNSNRSRRQQDGNCFICGEPGHYAKDCSKNSNNQSTSQGGSGSNSQSNNGRSRRNRRGDNRRGGRGSGGNSNGNSSSSGGALSDEVFQQLKAKIKERMKTMPSNASIPDDAKHTIEIDGKVLAKYCRHCKRFTKGNKAHFTTEHTSPNKVPYQPDGSQTQAAGMQATAREPTGPPQGLVSFGPRTQFDFSYMPTVTRDDDQPRAGGNLAMASSSSSSDGDSDSSQPGFMDVLNSRTPHPKGFGR